MAATATKTLPRLKEKYRSEIAPALHTEFGYDNVMQIPGLTKIVVNMGVGEAARDSKVIDAAVRDLTAITGQKPTVTKARKSIAQFKLREGMPIGCHVTLRGDRMWEFADRLLSLALPRIRGGRRIIKLRGMDITFVTTAATDDEGRALLKALGFPFKAPADEAATVAKKRKGPAFTGKKKR
jgi:large subunit ribosomal protein L5